MKIKECCCCYGKNIEILQVNNDGKVYVCKYCNTEIFVPKK